MVWAIAIAILIVAYLLGSTPTGYLVAKALKGIDIRTHGSGNTGATNVFRVVGKGAGITVLTIDLLKGSLAVIFARLAITTATLSLSNNLAIDDVAITPATTATPTIVASNDITPTALATLTHSPEMIAWVTTLAGLGVIIGHSRSIWLNFTGGKSAASGLGVLLALSWPVGLGVAGVFGGVFALSRIVSLGSITAAVAAPLLMALTGQPLPFFLLALAAGFYVVLRHRSNISRLLAGQEPKLGPKG